MQKTYSQKPYGNMKTDEATKIKRQQLKFFDSADWAMRLKNKTNSNLKEPLPKPSDDLIQEFKHKYEIVENQTSPIAICENKLYSNLS